MVSTKTLKSKINDAIHQHEFILASENFYRTGSSESGREQEVNGWKRLVLEFNCRLEPFFSVYTSHRGGIHSYFPLEFCEPNEETLEIYQNIVTP